MDALSFNPDNLQNIVFFLLPGLLATSLFFHQIPDRKKSDFILIILGVFLSYIFTTITQWLFTLINIITHLNTHLVDRTIYFSITRFFIAIALSILMAKFVKSKYFFKLNKIFGISYYPFGRVWNSFFNIPPNTVIKVFLVDGISYVGIVKSTSYDPNDDIQELELWWPYYYDKSTAKAILIKETETVLIEGHAIFCVEKVTKNMAKELYPKLSV